MKTIGLIGGMSWESTVVYYQQMNRAVRERMGGLHSGRILMHSFDFAEIAALQRADEWDTLADKLRSAGQGLERAGADAVAICTNTMHKVAPQVQAGLDVPLVDIRDVVASAARKAGATRVGLLGTLYTMEQEFYRAYLQDRWDLEVLIPEKDERAKVHDVIFGELCQGVNCPESKKALEQTSEHLVGRGAQAVILGCTELMLLVDEDDNRLPFLDSTTLHVDALVDFAFGGTLPIPAGK